MKQKQAVSVPPFLEDAFARLDNGKFGEAISQLEPGTGLGAGELEALWKAEILVYLDRVDDVKPIVEELRPLLEERVGDRGTLGECARRWRLIAAEVAYFDGDYDEAQTLAASVADVADMVDDPQHAMRATYDLGRIMRRRGDFSSSLETLLVAGHMAKRIDNEYYEGLIAYNRAVCCFELGDVDKLSEYAQAARELLARSENLRFYGVSENLYGLYRTELGDFEGGIASFDASERIASSLGVASDILSVANHASLALLARGRYAEAERRLANLVDLGRSEGHSGAELFALGLLSVAQTAQGRLAEARRSAEAASALAERIGSEDDKFEARLHLLRARALQGDESSLEQLREAIGDADRRGVDTFQVMARLFAAHAMVAESPVEATSLCRAVRAMPARPTGSWLAAELERIEYLLEHAPIRIDPEGRLVIDTRTSWPTIRAAREAAERYIYERAISATNGNASAAGRLIGESRYQMHHLGRILQGLAPRPSRSKDPDAAQKKPRRRRSRIVYG
jgi:ATP/maltotriose-dependent transcriptional regulator MalT